LVPYSVWQYLNLPVLAAFAVHRCCCCRCSATYTYRYVQQGLRAVNQAMGRVIRHRWDYGAVLLADERFGTQQNLRNMSKWLRDQVVQHNSFGGAIASLTRFFKVTCLNMCMPR
jgi:Rad3-related DNA helicase